MRDSKTGTEYLTNPTVSETRVLNFTLTTHITAVTLLLHASMKNAPALLLEVGEDTHFMYSKLKSSHHFL
jgi:hypothetical protein